MDPYLSRHLLSVSLQLVLLLISFTQRPASCTVTFRTEGADQGTSGLAETSGSTGQQNQTRPGTSGRCGSCWSTGNREERREYDRQLFQEKILQKLRMSHPPNFSNPLENIHLVPSIQNIINELEQEDRARRGGMSSSSRREPCVSGEVCPPEQDLGVDAQSEFQEDTQQQYGRTSGDEESSTVFTAFHLAENNAPNGPNVLKFDLGKYSDPDLLVSAVLGVHVMGAGQYRRQSNSLLSVTSPPSRSHEPVVVITLYRRIFLDSHHSPGGQLNEFLQKGRRKLLRLIQNTWQTFTITQQVIDWIRHPHTNHGLSLEVLDLRRRSMNILDLNCSDSFEHRPYLELQFRDPDSLPPSLSHSRSRRSIMSSQDCQGNTPQTMCCRYYLAIDFAAIGWDWIIAPQRTSAYYCAGQCPYLYQTVIPASYLVQQSSSLPGAPCCAPTKTSDLKIMYRGENGTFLQSVVPGLIVDRCGCW